MIGEDWDGQFVSMWEDPMAQNHRVVIVGGHGKIALLTAPKLTEAGYAVHSLIRNPDQHDEVAATGAQPGVLDIESADVDELTGVFTGATAVVFAAGAGGGNPARTHAVDYEAALRTMQAAEQAGVRRYVMVSYITAAVDAGRIDPGSSFFPYAKAKHDADAHLRTTGLDYTILGPASLTMDPATGKVLVVDEEGKKPDGDLPDDERVTSRENVAEVITHVLRTGAGIGHTYNFVDGPTPIEQAII